MAFHPYLYFDGDCKDAFARYHEIFGGNLVLMTGREAPPDAGIAEDKLDLVMHASILMDDGGLVMASDSYEDDFNPHSSTAVHYNTTDMELAKKVFGQLAEGGEIINQGETFWTPFYGQCTDRFGVPWQVSVEQQAS